MRLVRVEARGFVQMMSDDDDDDDDDGRINNIRMILKNKRNRIRNSMVLIITGSNLLEINGITFFAFVYCQLAPKNYKIQKFCNPNTIFSLNNLQTNKQTNKQTDR
jgi:hypothetical protein